MLGIAHGVGEKERRILSTQLALVDDSYVMQAEEISILSPVPGFQDLPKYFLFEI